MTASTITPLRDVQIGGGSDWVARRVGDALTDARTALTHTRSDWSRMPAIGPHPRQAAIDAAREAVRHVHEALSVEAPQDAIDDARRALAELNAGLRTLEGMPSLAPRDPAMLPVDRIITAIDLLASVEHRLATATSGYG